MGHQAAAAQRSCTAQTARRLSNWRLGTRTTTHGVESTAQCVRGSKTTAAGECGIPRKSREDTMTPEQWQQLLTTLGDAGSQVYAAAARQAQLDATVATAFLLLFIILRHSFYRYDDILVQGRQWKQDSMDCYTVHLVSFCRAYFRNSIHILHKSAVGDIRNDSRIDAVRKGDRMTHKPPYGWHTYVVEARDEFGTWKLRCEDELFPFASKRLADAKVGETWEVAVGTSGLEFDVVTSARLARPCYKCGSSVKVRHGPDPYKIEINDDKTPVWECEKCRVASNNAIPWPRGRRC